MKTPTPTNDEWIVTDNENYIEIASTKTRDSIASIHGGKTVGDQYDLARRIAKIPQLERELTTVTKERDKLDDQLEHILLQLGRAQERMIDAERKRDRLAEALRMITTFDYTDLQCDNGHGPRSVATEALQSLNQNK